MYRRRRPILGAALLVGASRSAARNEVEKQAQRSAETQMAAERAVDKSRREEEERERRTQLAIDEAIARERSRAQNADRAPPNFKDAPTGHGTAYQIGQASPYVSYGQSVGEKQGANIRYCPNCAYVCALEDKFCSRCGQKQLAD
ncbi:hypothetical protein B0J11DRAFT_619797 [Dendryphion nanum]|uniref:Uncharacterized protein n=1 Tax=Dendryphion nanum TaxID=256645 RepID=A0A9P9D4D1_9PLEO|nr:hypothetical protein B0J11DRAFT_619797 [Dendryphion nanum]